MYSPADRLEHEQHGPVVRQVVNDEVRRQRRLAKLVELVRSVADECADDD